MKALRRLWSRVLVRTEGAPRRPSVPRLATAMQRLGDGLRHADWGTVLEALDRLDVVVRPGDDALLLEGPPLSEALQAQLQASREPLMEALRHWAFEVSPLGRTLLFQAWRMTPRRVQQLLALGVNLRAQDRLGRTALHEAVTHQRAELVALLVEAGAPLAISDQGWRTPLHVAAEDGAVDVVKLLLAGSEPPINAQDHAGMTPLHEAAVHARTAVVEALLAAGAEVDPLDRERRTPLLMAVQRGDEETVALLLAKAADPAARGANPTPLAVALQRHRTAIAGRLVRSGATWPPGGEVELLRMALRQRDHELLGALLARDVDHALLDGSLLVEAVTLDDATAAQQLLEAGAAANAGDNLPLKLAVYHGRTLLALRLKEAGALVDPIIQVYEVRLHERPFRFHLDMAAETIVRSEVWQDEGWCDVESESPPQPAPEAAVEPV